MLINYQNCKFYSSDYTWGEDDEILIHICSHPSNNDKACELPFLKEGDCKLLDIKDEPN